MLESISIAFDGGVTLMRTSSALAIALFISHAVGGTMCGNAQ
ncbi:hypothetical protein WCN79_19220 [Xanthomonas axonopodis pv. vasculorum]|nr:hypothetical protein [Xanthomonas axonopodis]